MKHAVENVVLSLRMFFYIARRMHTSKPTTIGRRVYHLAKETVQTILSRVPSSLNLLLDLSTKLEVDLGQPLLPLAHILPQDMLELFNLHISLELLFVSRAGQRGQLPALQGEPRGYTRDRGE